MSRTSHTFSVLQATAAVASIAIIMWSLGLPVMQFAQAANVTTLTNTLSDSGPGNESDHTIEFITPTGVVNGETITVDFSDGPFVVGAVDFTDIDVQATSTDLTVAADCTGSDQIGAAFTGTTLTITFCTGDGASLAAGASTTIEIGLNADGGDEQLVNPVADVNSYQIPVTAGVDSGETRVMILDQVTVSATVDTIFTFTVNAVASGATVGSDTTGTTTTATAIAFGELAADTETSAAQRLEVSTNAANGFAVTVATDQQLTAGNGAIIDGYRDGAYDTVPDAWFSPGGTPGQPNEAGHWGLTSDDDTLSGGDTYNGGTEFVSASTTPVEVFRHGGPVAGGGAGEGTANVLYKIEVTALQEAADDYTATLTYVATPIF